MLENTLRGADAWVDFADAYLVALDGACHDRRRAARGQRERARALAEWNLLLLDRLTDTDAEDRLDALTHHPALAGEEQRYLRAQLAHRRGDVAGSGSMSSA